MCAIVGFVDFNKKSDYSILVDMTDILSHRGPDDSGYTFFDTINYNLGLGHRRLSILDLSTNGHQPMKFENLEIIYNGEIYNFKEIKKELQQEGYQFNSNSDTEVILKAYHKWGIKALDKFNGMFSIAIYDKNLEKLFLIRDRAGVKPLYYYFCDNLFLFGSELKSFHKNPYFKKEINKEGLSIFLEYGYIFSPFTIFKHTHKLKGGEYLIFDLNNKTIEIKKYWDIYKFYNQKIDISYKEAVEETEKLLKKGFEYRLVSDVEVGVFLSGGYDSSLLVAMLDKKLKTYTIGFENSKIDESKYAKNISKLFNTDHTEYICSSKEAFDILPMLPEIYDEPFGDSSTIPTILVSKLAKKDLKVVLSADGGDELFAGYDKYDMALSFQNRFDKFKKFRNLFKILNLLNPEYIPILNKQYNNIVRFEKIKNILQNNNEKTILKSISQFYTPDYIRRLLNKNFSNYLTSIDDLNKIKFDFINKILAIDFVTYLQDDILYKVDRASMSVSLEAREPYLDKNLIEFVATLPTNFKYNQGIKKHILKDIVYKYIPKEMMDRPKMGFGAPIEEWFKEELKDIIFYYINENKLKHNIFNIQEIIKIRDRYFNNQDDIKKLWLILVFQMWYEKWM